ncbi:MAG TPA: monovalent cation:proton antiporter-2 (CPA2) family protein [Chthoniobacterales bacterium]|jgi:monovalent cation:proton antiporter-2 (CPA2) family protein|nr:monovalent cation:proton antiporter-2 (CPA2) family protein [Chthoniobacterales bacterium]
MGGGLYQAFIYLLAAIVAVPVAKRLGLGSIIGYLLAGAVIGPYALRFVQGGGDVMHFAEFGVVMMLFVIGLELRPALLWQMRRPILGLGGLQVVATAAVFGAVAVWLGFPWKSATAIGLILTMSSTAIALQSLGERGLMKTPGGEAAFAVLLFQDIAVIPILALMPLLATGPVIAPAGHGGLMESLPGWQQGLVVVAAVTTIVLAGRFLLRPFFRYIAGTRLREMFTATALFIVVGIAMLMQKLGLSPALGTFVAGVVLAESEYRVQLEADIEPFKGLLLGLFFISVGASIDFSLVAQRPTTIAALVTGLLALKFVVLIGLGRLFRLRTADGMLFAFAMAQGGEFAFVLFSFATQNAVLPTEVANLLIAAVALSMAAAPILLTAEEKLIRPLFQKCKPERPADEIDEHDNPVILAGFGRFGHIVGRLLRANGFGTTVLDHDADQVDTLGRFGMKSFYGDASRLDLLQAAGAARAKLFVLAIDDETKALQIIETIRHEFPHLKIMARATSRQHAYEILRLGVDQVYRETLGSALDLSIDALRELGMDERRARRAAEIFRKHDEASVREMAVLPDDDEAYVSIARKHIENLERALESDVEMRGESLAADIVRN